MLGVKPGCEHVVRNENGGLWDGRDESEHCMEHHLRRKELKEN